MLSKRKPVVVRLLPQRFLYDVSCTLNLVERPIRVYAMAMSPPLPVDRVDYILALTGAMKPDAYTKVLLTVIAAAMLVMTARVYEQPASVFAQRSGTQPAQHVIIDSINPTLGRLPVVIDGRLPVVIEDVGFIARSLPVSIETAGPLARRDPLGSKALHVIIDDLESTLSAQGLPVRMSSQGASAPLRGAQVPAQWEYTVEGCTARVDGFNAKGAVGWEPIHVWAHPTTKDPTACIGFFKRPVR